MLSFVKVFNRSSSLLLRSEYFDILALYFRVVTSFPQAFLVVLALFAGAPSAGLGLSVVDELLELVGEAVASTLLFWHVVAIVGSILAILPRPRAPSRPRKAGVPRARSLVVVFLRFFVKGLLNVLEEVVLGNKVGLVDGSLPHLPLIMKVMIRQKPKAQRSLEAQLIVGLQFPPNQPLQVVLRQLLIEYLIIIQHEGGLLHAIVDRPDEVVVALEGDRAVGVVVVLYCYLEGQEVFLDLAL